jgi:hypothetical protein
MMDAPCWSTVWVEEAFTTMYMVLYSTFWLQTPPFFLLASVRPFPSVSVSCRACSVLLPIYPDVDRARSLPPSPQNCLIFSLPHPCHLLPSPHH